MKEITASELKMMMDTKEDFLLIDVREPYEVEMENIGGVNIPVGEAMGRQNEINRDKKVIVYCRSGNRSGSIIQALERQAGFTNLYNLKGGILAWNNLKNH